jgi:hypothetical protein
MPTFQFFKSGNKIDEIKGADKAKLEAAVKEHQGPNDLASVPASVGSHTLINEIISMKQV